MIYIQTEMTKMVKVPKKKILNSAFQDKIVLKNCVFANIFQEIRSKYTPITNELINNANNTKGTHTESLYTEV